MAGWRRGSNSKASNAHTTNIAMCWLTAADLAVIGNVQYETADVFQIFFQKVPV